jgi:hypothetical protein
MRDIKIEEAGYLLTTDDVKRNGGALLLHNHYKGSLQKALTSIYPDVVFKKPDENFWDKLENQRKYFDWLADRLNIQTFDDWYSVSREECDIETGSLD